MGKRMCAIAAAVLFAAGTSSCGSGRTLRLEGNNVVQGSTAAVTTATEPPTTAEPTTEAETQPSTLPSGAPLPISVVVKCPDDYEVGTKFAIYLDTVMQKPELPTGCEITALTELLNFYGFGADKVELADIFMPNDRIGYYSMNEAYIGDPHHNDGFGCNAPVIVKTANDYFEYIGSDWYAVDLTGSPMRDVYYNIEQGRPAVIWTTINQAETRKQFEFRLGDGEDFYFNPMQHCVVIYGFDYEEKVVHVADPLVGNRKYDIARFERIYSSMDKQAVVLCGNEESAGVDYTTEDEKKAWLDENRYFTKEDTVWMRKNYPEDREPVTEALPEPEPAIEPSTSKTTEAKT
ncbi:MAG: C39 family peptidase [Ruminococcus sp.]|nr:C39 family peptidase [Ruminococcus sp.]